MDFSMEECLYESESHSQFSDDSHDDPSFDFVEETRLMLSDLSFKRKSRRPDIGGITDQNDEDEVEEFDVKDEQNYEIIKKMIEVGQVDRLKVDQCKIYLRKHGLRLSGKKEILIQRIKEHVEIVNGGGEEKYPVSSFVLNCKGDSCKGDIVLFEQNVYEEFSKISRSSSGGPCGIRVVAGRILKESYGAAKQQHTFTIEVLWSRGEKPLPPLYPLLIKGRNLYRLNTRRQKWEDEGERQRILFEKHARGAAARSDRDARRTTKATRNELPNKKQERREPLHFVRQQQECEAHCYTRTQEFNIPVQPVHQRQPLMAMECNYPRAQHAGSHPNSVPFLKSPTRVRFHDQPRPNHPCIYPSDPSHPEIPSQQLSRVHHMQNRKTYVNRPIHQRGNEQKQICRYFGQGRCYFGDRCKYSHESAGNK